MWIVLPGYLTRVREDLVDEDAKKTFGVAGWGDIYIYTAKSHVTWTTIRHNPPRKLRIRRD